MGLDSQIFRAFIGGYMKWCECLPQTSSRRVSLLCFKIYMPPLFCGAQLSNVNRKIFSMTDRPTDRPTTTTTYSFLHSSFFFISFALLLFHYLYANVLRTHTQGPIHVSMCAYNATLDERPADEIQSSVHSGLLIDSGKQFSIFSNQLILRI